MYVLECDCVFVFVRGSGLVCVYVPVCHVLRLVAFVSVLFVVGCVCL